ncbi:MAG: hypothetical protein IH865_07860 [Chloroflexi bacterium]|nr:hypothetical protein [Chloroflexota bacterium]
MTKTKSALPILLGGAVVIGGVGLLAKRRLRPKSVSLTDADLSVDEWRAVVEFENADTSTNG